MDEKLFQAFKIANSGWYIAKHQFYDLKEEILKKYGTPDGYDLQKINHPCECCLGTGIWYTTMNGANKIKCGNCKGAGIVKTETHYLLRYILNGEVFHLPQNYDPGPLFAEQKNVIIGKIRHKVYTPEEHYKAFLLVAHHFDQRHLNAAIRYNPQAKYYWEQLQKENCMRLAV